MADLFESSLDLEGRFIAEGYEDGIRCGKAAGLQEGISLGIDKGFEIGSELGQYEGTVETLLALQALQPGLFNERTEKALHAIKDVISTFPEGPQDDSLQDVMADLRGKFKALVAMTGLRDLFSPEPAANPSMAF